MRILIVAPSDLPIPAIGGGAIETLMTYFIKENEVKKKLEIDVITPNFKGLKDIVKEFHFTKFVIYKEKVDIFSKIYNVIRWKLRKFSGTKLEWHGIYLNFLEKFINKNGKKYDKIIFAGDPIKTIAAKKTKEKNILHIHTDIYNERFSYVLEVNKYVGEFWAVSEYIKRQIKGVVEKDVPIKVIPNCADLKQFKYKISQKEKENLRKQYGLSKDDFVVLFVGRIDESKGVKELVTAGVGLDYENIKFLIVGGHFFSNDMISPYMKLVQEEANKKPGKFIFTGNILHSEINKFYNMADIAVVPSKCNEAAGLSLIEARVSGLPVITTFRGGIPEYAGEGCILIKDISNHFVESLQQAIIKLYEDNKLCDEMRKINLEKREKFSIERYYEDIIRALE